MSAVPQARLTFFCTFTAGRTVLHNAGMSKLLLLVFLFAQEEAKPAVAPPTTVVTIHSALKPGEFDVADLMKRNAKQIPGMAIVQQRRTLELNEGETTLSLPMIASAADFSTLSLRPASGDGFRVLNQSLIAPAANPDELLRRAVGHDIIINRKAPLIADHARTPETINAKLLSFDDKQLVVETNNRQLPLQIVPRNSEIAEIKLFAGSAAPTTQPAVSARIAADKAGPQEAILSYHTHGITWHADYEIVLGEDQSKAGLTSNITILNRSGTSLDDARINLIASGRAGAAGQAVYALPQTVSLPAEAAQRVPLLDTANPNCQIILACGPGDYGRSPAFASSYLAIENSSKNNLGRSMPPGRVRIYKQSTADAAPALLAEDTLPPIAQNDLVLIRLGAASQVTAKREVNERFDTDKTAANQTIQITLRNRSDQAQKIVLIEPRPAPAHRILDKSMEFENQSQSMLFRIDLPANGEKVVSYTTRRPAQ